MLKFASFTPLFQHIMKLSVIIVNYNVKFFLEQCLQSVFKALKNISSEVFVVDNNSVDGSPAMVKEKFPAVRLIVNSENVGFSTANNMAAKQSQGEYVLLLNPDTVVEEDTFLKVIAYMDENPDAGALGVKMIDGKGNFLPESKRGLPTPWVAFYKIFGFSRLFRKSRVFGRYHLSFLDKNKVQNIDVLCGAFMLLRRSVLDRVGLLDESFFMYGEDIDLSYRIQKAGFRIVYFPETTIIHYKGESTKKNSLNYVYLFYNAMLIFARKHFSEGKVKSLSILIHLAIYFRAFLSLAKRSGMKLLLPLLDIFLIYFAMKLVARFWGDFWFGVSDYYPLKFYNFWIPLYVAIWFISLFFSGSYDRPLKFKNLFTGIGIGTLIILVLYALSPQDYRFSRILVLAGALTALVISSLTRLLLSFTRNSQFNLQIREKRRVIIVGDLPECQRIRATMLKLKLGAELVGFVSGRQINGLEFIGHLSQLGEIIRIYKVNEIVFCSGDIPASEIISLMSGLSHSGCYFKIAPPGAESIIGSNSINTAGDLYVYSVNSVASPKNIRIKRTFDLGVSLVMICLLPIWVWIKRHPFAYLKSILNVIVNRNSWVGYSGSISVFGAAPQLKKGVYPISIAYPESERDPEIKDKLDLAYAQDYQVSHDIKILAKALLHDFTLRK